MDFPRVVQIIQSIIGLGLNILVIYITSLKQKLNGLDLKLMSIVAILDMIFYINCLARVILYQVLNGEVSKFPKWWCLIDSILTLSNYQSTMEIIAILGLLRYNLVELNRGSTRIWKYLALTSIFSSLILGVANHFFNSAFLWGTGNLVCIPAINKEKSNVEYFYFWYTQLCIRMGLSVVIISFCYMKIATLFRKIMSQPVSSGCEDWKNWTTEKRINEGKSRKAMNNTVENNVIAQISSRKIEQMKETFTWKILGFIIIYFIIVIPDLVLIIFYMAKDYKAVNALAQTTHVLISFCGIVNPLFVLFVHDPSKRLLKELFTKSKPFSPYQQTIHSLPSILY